MDKFLERYNLPRLNQKGTENTNRLVTSTKIETVILKLPTNKSLGSDGFASEFYQTFREELTPILLKLFWKLQRKEHSQAHSTRPPLPWYQNQTEIPQKRKLETNIIDEHRGKSLEQNTSKKKKKIHQYIKRIIYLDQVGLTPEVQGFFNIHKSIICDKLH